MKGLKKATAFFYTYWGILGIYLAALIASPESAQELGVAVVAALVGLSGVSQGANVADNYQKSKYYRAELDKGEECVEPHMGQN
jgi:hypothetical protein